MHLNSPLSTCMVGSRRGLYCLCLNQMHIIAHNVYHYRERSSIQLVVSGAQPKAFLQPLGNALQPSAPGCTSSGPLLVAEPDQASAHLLAENAQQTTRLLMQSPREVCSRSQLSEAIHQQVLLPPVLLPSPSNQKSVYLQLPRQLSRRKSRENDQSRPTAHHLFHPSLLTRPIPNPYQGPALATWNSTTPDLPLNPR